MAKFTPMKILGTVLERRKDEKTRKKTVKNGVTNPKKDKKEKKAHFKKKEGRKREGERSFLNGNVFLSFPILANFNQRTSLVTYTIVASGLERHLQAGEASV